RSALQPNPEFIVSLRLLFCWPAGSHPRYNDSAQIIARSKSGVGCARCARAARRKRICLSRKFLELADPHFADPIFPISTSSFLQPCLRAGVFDSRIRRELRFPWLLNK